MARSHWKYNYISKSMFKKLIILKLFKYKTKGLKLKQFFTINRNSIIPKSFEDSKIGIHNGMNFVYSSITLFMLGRKFGEFSFSKKPFFFPIKEKKKKKLIKR